MASSSAANNFPLADKIKGKAPDKVKGKVFEKPRNPYSQIAARDQAMMLYPDSSGSNEHFMAKDRATEEYPYEFSSAATTTIASQQNRDIENSGENATFEFKVTYGSKTSQLNDHHKNSGDGSKFSYSC